MTSKRFEAIPEDFVLYLSKRVPGFALEEPSHQWALARMVWIGSTKRRQHHHFEGAMSFHYKELERDFGAGNFNRINARLGIFNVSNQWFSDQGMTRGFWLSEHIEAIKGRYLDRRSFRITRLLTENGKALKTLPTAVASKDQRGITTTAWKSARTLNRVRVDVQTLRDLKKWLRLIIDDYEAGRMPGDLLISSYPHKDVIHRLIETIGQILRLAKTDVAGNGYVMHHYVQATSGRLFAKGINLQTAPSLIKQAALSGLREYDFSNCHYSILEQMAAKQGFECQSIRAYLAHKKATREEIAKQAGITTDEAKVCLLAIMYGARLSEWHENAIPEAIGQASAARLYQIPLFNAIYQDIKQARQVILKTWPRTANGSLSNAFGTAISGKEKAEEQLAHLIQGVEARALKAALDLYPDHIVLLQHDGFAATARLDARAIEKAVLDATGYSLPLEEKVIQLDPNEHFLKHRIQNKNASKPNIHAGSSHS